MKVQDEDVSSMTICRPRPLISRPYILPFIFLYIAIASIYYFTELLGTAYPGFLASIITGFIAIIHGMCFLGTKWSVYYRFRTEFIKMETSEIDRATHIYVVPHVNHGTSSICNLEHKRTSNGREINFEFQKVRYLWNSDKHTFIRIEYPSELPLSHYFERKGYLTEVEVENGREKYGPNSFKVPMPTFWELYAEHAVAPFFVFQVFCVGLWCLDEYPQYAIFTLVMLLVLEGLTVFSRIKSLESLRKTVDKPPHSVLAHRKGRWQQVMSDDLLPGDIISVVACDTCPCDAVLLTGSCVVNESMLTGESTPHLKEPIENDPNLSEILSPEGKHKGNIVYAGTQIIQAGISKDGKQHPSVSAPNNGGCHAMVIRSGFETAQGKLMRTILFVSEHVTANNKESFAFIGFLLIFALVASAYVFRVGLADPTRSKWKLFLNCIMIITSVVPPELPMELSIAVQNSLLALRKCAVFCTEPFRIPYAGHLDKCCFDKTGTLTSDDLHLLGVAACNPDDPKALSEPAALPEPAILALAGCHSLVLVGGKPLGDPVESAAINALGWNLTPDRVTETNAAPTSQGKGKRSVRIAVRFPFSSELRRMSTIIGLSVGGSSETFYVVAKGAPEKIKEMCSEVPSYYDSVCAKYARQGGRVLALAIKPLGQKLSKASELRAITRDKAESGLTFAGLAVFGCTIKPESTPTISALKGASLSVAMITGDNILTACHVARQTGIADRPLLELVRSENDENELVWREIAGGKKGDDSDDSVTTFPLEVPIKEWDWSMSYEDANSDDDDDDNDLDFIEDLELKTKSKALAKIISECNDENKKSKSKKKGKKGTVSSRKWDLAIDGSVLDSLLALPCAKEVLLHTAVFARVAPEQKERIVSELRNSGLCVLMCGDGTNDVGALRQAEVGVALLTVQPAKLSSSQNKHPNQKQQQQQQQRPPAQRPTSFMEMYKQIREQQEQLSKLNSAAERKAELERRRKELMTEMSAGEELAVAQLGDASIASPFTCRSTSIAPVTDIIRQGRCTHVSTHQIYRILALNSLISAYTLSFLYFKSIKPGDKQMTAMGFLTAFCFLFLSRSKPCDKLSKKRPITKLFHPSTVLSIILQWGVHLAALMATLRITEATLPPDYKPDDLDADFKPNLLNSTMFLIECAMTISCFLVNHRGHPFMESLSENRGLAICIALLSGITVFSALEVSPEWNAFFELVPMPSPTFRYTLVGIMAADLILAWVLDRVICLIFRV